MAVRHLNQIEHPKNDRAIGMKTLWKSTLAMVASGAVSMSCLAAEPIVPITAPAQPGAIALETGGMPGTLAPESWFRQDGRPFVRNVARATLQPFLPAPSKANGLAVIVAPGGGFLMLSMENEGWAVARALADRGIAAFVLKYRLRPTPAAASDFEAAVAAMFANAGDPKGRLKPEDLIRDRREQIADARAAFALVRARASDWHVDPDRVGMIGFSAGAMTTMMTMLAAPDTKPAFIGPIYGSMEAVTVAPGAPPMFAVLAADDPLFAKKGFGVLDSWQSAGRPVEFHLYQAGGHGFGLGKQGTTSTDWFAAFLHWLQVNHFLEQRPPVR
jgi:acetyl esterase/lipase